MPWGRGAILPPGQLGPQRTVAGSYCKKQLKHCFSHKKKIKTKAAVRCTRQAGLNSRHPESSKEASKKASPSSSNANPNIPVPAAYPTDNLISPV